MVENGLLRISMVENGHLHDKAALIAKLGKGKMNCIGRLKGQHYSTGGPESIKEPHHSN
jgi:hypothetical protein